MYICQKYVSMAIANIITTESLPYSDIQLFNVSSNEIIDDKLPTLIIGWKLVKSIFSDEANILDKNIKKNVYWTYSKYEKREEYEIDVISFITKIINDKILEFNYIPINIFSIKYNSIKNILKFLSSKEKKICYTSYNKQMYIYSDKIIYGISIDDLMYIGISKKKLYKFFKNVTYINNTDFLSIELKKIINSNQIIIPYLYQKTVSKNIENYALSSQF